MNDYIEEIYKSEQVRTVTKGKCVILDAKFEKPDLHKVTGNQRQHLKEAQSNELLKLLQKPEELFYGTLGN